MHDDTEPPKRVLDQVAHPRIPHAYMYCDCLIVLEGTTIAPSAIRVAHITLPNGDNFASPFEEETLPALDALRHACELIDLMPAEDKDGPEVPTSFRADLLDLQVNYIQGHLSLGTVPE